MDLWTDPLVDPSLLPRSIADVQSSIDPWQDDGKKKAAVAVLWIPARGEGERSQLVLTRRTTSVGSHKGQIAFAGGRADAADGDPATTAMREASEELGIPRDRMRSHGALPEIRSIDGSRVVPVLVTCDLWPESFVLSAAEVDYAIIEPWDAYRREYAKSFDFRLFGRKRQSHLFQIGDDRVWGLTASIIYKADLR